MMIMKEVNQYHIEYLRRNEMKNLEKLIYKWVKENYGQSEVENPSWDIQSLVNYLQAQLNKKKGGK